MNTSIIIILILAFTLLISLYWNLKLYKKYQKFIKPNWEILEDRLVNIGLSILKDASETSKLGEKIEALEKEIAVIKKSVSKT
ncbi:hypothetical protein [Mongoliitalea lutea]|uniref:Uncharacterized protein n=1 Tax=Mongoliitalea lutea TaxID=849756 RepID=A0A8J3CYJ0_9BACT|nr:hypothetical protein [Mongoliitalea lutea]GHB34888.1 hypothetical protein GCM10008106_15280 [Mongoliitalea lutea]